jgi:hypothetical protein
MNINYKKMMIGIFGLLIALGCFYASYKMIIVYKNVQKWQATTATVLEKKIEKRETHSTRANYGLMVTYQYQFNNKTYQNDKVFLVDLMGGQANHSSPEFAKPYADQINNPLTIYVNQDNPNESIIFRDGIMLYIGIALLGIFSLLVAIGYFYGTFRS